MIDDSEFQCDVYTTAVPVISPGYRCTVRIVHLPTGLVASCSDTKSIAVNQERAMTVLRGRLRRHDLIDMDEFRYAPGHCATLMSVSESYTHPFLPRTYPAISYSGLINIYGAVQTTLFDY